MSEQIKVESFTLRKDNAWVAQVLISSDGMLAVNSDYGNFNCVWRSTGGEIKKFILGISIDYYSHCIRREFGYICMNNKISDGIYRFAEIILPLLQQKLMETVE